MPREPLATYDEQDVYQLRSWLAEEQAANTARFTPADPSPRAHADAAWAFLTSACYTFDQIEGKKRPFPAHLDYLKVLVDTWCAERLLLVPKSRRMIVTWTMCALHYWLARWGHAGAKIALVSRKEGRSESEGSAELVWRCKYIHEQVPRNVTPCVAEHTFARLRFPHNGSEIIGVGQGADQLRQHTLTAIFADEMAFWEQAQETYTASRPTIEGGGRFTGVSSAHPGFFKALCHDEI